jgi:preprotein translocase subunit Sec61beta
MAKENKMQMPGVFGGLMRYDSEYKSRFTFSPAAVIGFVIAVVILVILLKVFLPIDTLATDVGSIPVPGVVIVLLKSFKGVFS